MRGPGFFGASLTIARKDLLLEWRTFETLSSTLVFALIVLVLFSFAFGSGTIRDLGAERLVPGVLWSVLAFSVVSTAARSLELERRGDTLSALALAPVGRGALYVGKLLANLLKLTLLQCVVFLLSALFFSIDPLRAPGLVLALLLAHGVGLTELGTLFAAVATRLGRGEALLATLLFPASTPIFISAVECTRSVLATGTLSAEARSWLLLTLVFDLLYLLVSVATIEFVLEE